MIRRQPLFPFLLVLFFVFHGYVENYPIVPLDAAALLFLTYLGVSILLFFISWLFFRDIIRASILTFSLLGIQFFFGPVQDLLKKTSPLDFLARYSVIIPLILLLIICIALVLRRKKWNFYLFIYYVNILLLVLLVIDASLLAIRLNRHTRVETLSEMGLNNCTDCAKPDIYLIITDGYAGQEELDKLFNFDNSAFSGALRERGFHIIDSSRSNYNFTYFSIASMLNMGYLEGIKGINRNKEDQLICNERIRYNRFVSYLRASGYQVFNNSIFNLEGEPAINSTSFLPLKTSLISNQTFSSRIRKELGYHLVTTFKLSSAIRSNTFSERNNNRKAFERTVAVAKRRTNTPKFVFTHLMMPHYPYYYDSSGRENAYEFLQEGSAFNKDLYIGYLKYCNSQLLKLIDSIRSGPGREPIIILMSDHGFREFSQTVEERYLFQNLAAISLPGKNYDKFYKGITPVNIFRTLLNTEFRQGLTLLPDSTILINE